MRVASLLAALFIGSCVADAPTPAAQRWHLVVEFFDAQTDEQIYEQEMHGSAEPRGGYVYVTQCMDDATSMSLVWQSTPRVRFDVVCRIGPIDTSIRGKPKLEI